MARIDTTVAAYWNGQGALGRVFWLWGVVGSWVLAGLFLAAASVIGISVFLYLLSGLVMIPYTVWILVSVWRCADNAHGEHWPAIARSLTVAWALNVVLVGAFLGFDLLATIAA